MMKKHAFHVLLFVALTAATTRAQLIREGEGFEWKGFTFRPEASAVGSYDNRVVMVSADEAEGDFYSELVAGLGMRNLPARYYFNAFGNYGYRMYNEYSGLSDDFYKANAAVGTDDGKLNWRLAADYSKRLNYSTVYDPNTGSGPDSILANEPNKRFVANGRISYAAPMSEKSSLVPEYSLSHYYQEFERTGGSAEWQTHRIAIPVTYAISDKTLLSLGGAGTLQLNREEQGRIATVYGGVESRATDKVTYGVNVGYSWVTYELSGEDQGFVSDARVVWRATEKVNAYVFAGNRYQPGYGGGGARVVYRAGYGAGWTPVDQWFLGAQVLHDYQQAIGDSNSSDYGDPRHFFNARLGYKFVRWADLALTGKYVKDEVEVDQVVVSVRLDCRF